MAATMDDRAPVPRDPDDDYTRGAAEMRRRFLRERTGATLEHVSSFSFDPAVLPGNVEHFTAVINAAAESTTRSGRLQDIEQYRPGAALHPVQRHDPRRGRPEPHGQGEAGGGRWIVEHYPDVEQYCLESNFATDKKSSQVNMLRGKRVVTEAVIPDAVRQATMHAGSELLFRAREVANLGGFMSGGQQQRERTRPTASPRGYRDAARSRSRH